MLGRYSRFQAMAESLRSMLVLSMLLLLWTANAAQAQGVPALHAALNLEITNIDTHQGGALVVRVYDQAGWLHPEQAAYHRELSVPNRDRLQVVIPDLPYPATYAIEVFHDANSNHVLDMRWFPFPAPKEAYGFSNHYTPFAKPDFIKASFLLDAPEYSVQIPLHQ
ncbi:MAG: DUF2141 domain-containing protein [Mariprofundales bacterium]|nr:DUF2141 domain-containing protein [Mariprofundales bacterium]